MIPQPRTNFEERVASYRVSEQQKVNAIISAVFEAVNIKDANITKLNIRSQWLVEPTAVAMYLIYCNTSLSLTATGRPFGQPKDHSTVLYSIQKTQEFIDSKDDAYTKIIRDAKRILLDDYAITLSDDTYTTTSKRKLKIAPAKPVEKLSIDGDVIEHYESARSAAMAMKTNHTNIISACNLGHTTSGFRWRYKGNKEFIYKKPLQKHVWKIIQTDIDSNEIATFDNVTKAGKKIGMKAKDIKKAIQDKFPLKGFWFEKKFVPVN